MSLINDALKRARHEALRQESESGPVVYGAVPAHSRRVRRPWLLFVAGAAATIVVVSVVWLMWGRGHSSSTQSESVGEGSPAALSPASALQSEGAASALDMPLRTEESVPGVAAPGNEPKAEEGGTAAVSAPLPAGREPAALTPPVVVPPTEPPARQSSDERLQSGKTYLRRASAADGSEVRLGGIAYSDTHPIAVINGAVVSRGDLIAGFTVVAVEPEHVELEADGVRIFLTLH